jgi:hypothetical protein
MVSVAAERLGQTKKLGLQHSSARKVCYLGYEDWQNEIHMKGWKKPAPKDP